MEKNPTEVFVWYDDLRTDVLSAGRLEGYSKIREFVWPARREGRIYVVGWGKRKGRLSCNFSKFVAKVKLLKVTWKSVGVGLTTKFYKRN